MNKLFLGLALILSMNVGATTIEDTSKQVTTNNSQEVIAVNEQIEPSKTFTERTLLENLSAVILLSLPCLICLSIVRDDLKETVSIPTKQLNKKHFRKTNI